MSKDKTFNTNNLLIKIMLYIGDKMKLTDQVIKAVLNGQSGAIRIDGFSEKGTRSIGNEEAEKFVNLFQLTTENFVIKGTRIIPVTDLGWKILNSLNEQLETFRLKTTSEWDIIGYKLDVNHQDASFASCHLYPESLALLGLSYDHEKMRKDRAQNDLSRKLAGYGTSRMGGWVDR